MQKDLVFSMKHDDIREQAARALLEARSQLNRSYLADLAHYEVVPIDAAHRLNRDSDIRIFRVERLVYENKQSVLESATAAYTALGAAGYTVFLYLASDGRETQLYIGTRGRPSQSLGSNAGMLLQEAFKGHFAGSALHSLPADEVGEVIDRLLANQHDPEVSITAVTGVPSLSTDDADQFVQGLERFLDAAERRVYQAMLLAEPVAPARLEEIRLGYEATATQLAPLKGFQLSYGEQDNDSVGTQISRSLTETLGYSLGLTATQGESTTVGTSHTRSTGTSESSSTGTIESKVASVAAAGIGIGATVALGPLGVSVGMAVGSVLGSAFGGQESIGINSSESHGTSESVGTSTSESIASTQSSSTGNTETSGSSETHTRGSSRQMTVAWSDKGIEQLLTRIDHHLARLDEARTYGGWNSAAYFIANGSAATEALSSIFLGLVRGKGSSEEDFALTTWSSDKNDHVLDWLGNLTHPLLERKVAVSFSVHRTTPATLISGREVALQLSLPRRSTSTVSVVETQAFGRRVQRLDGGAGHDRPQRALQIGHIRHLWENQKQLIHLGLDQLCSHVFISGSTGSGKSNAIYHLLEQVHAQEIPFLVIEPAKGEYKHVLGHWPGVRVLGTNPGQAELLRINPFAFPAQIHVLEHVDRMVEIFNVCWPMYAAMPAVLKEALLQAYEACDWDLVQSSQPGQDRLFPSFVDLLDALQSVVDASDYSAETKANYLGALGTRVKSLTNGLNGQLFSVCELADEALFDRPVIVDLSRVGSVETKSLIMGILVMRLTEHRMSEGGMNLPLRHVTVLEEAHNILRCSAEQGSSAREGGVVGKSVEMLTNAIAEMRTYGEAFLLVDQSPHAVDLAAIRNTNTKLILRLPEEADRRLIGKSVGLSDEQVAEIARLPRGVAIVHQNDWLEPVLCQIDHFAGEARPYVRANEPPGSTRGAFLEQALNLLLGHRLQAAPRVNLAVLREGLRTKSLRATSRVALERALRARVSGTAFPEQAADQFEMLAELIVDLLQCRESVQRVAQMHTGADDLHRRLSNLLRSAVPGIADDISLVAEQCLVRDYVTRKPAERRMYEGWTNEVKRSRTA